MNMGLGECGYNGCKKRVQQTDRRHYRCKPCEKLHKDKLNDSRCGIVGHEYATMIGYECLECILEERDKYKKSLEEISTSEEGDCRRTGGSSFNDLRDIASNALKSRSA